MNTDTLIWIVFVALILAVMLWTGTHGPNWVGSDDEGFRLHAAWLTAQGYVPYRGFFDNQMPNYNYMGAPLAWLTGTSPGPMRASQWIYFGLAGLCFLVVSRLEDPGYLTGAIATFLVGASPIAGRLTAEFRPDLPAIALTLLSLVLILYGFRKSGSPKLHGSVSGLLLGIAVFLKPSAMFGLPVVIVLLLLEREGLSSPLLTGAWFGTAFLGSVVVQLLLWHAISPRFLEYTVITHRLSLPAGNLDPVLYGILVDHLPLVAGLIFFVGLPERSKAGTSFFLGGLVGLAFYVLFPPNTPQSRHLFGPVVFLAYPAGEAYTWILRRYVPSSRTVIRVFIVLVLVAATVFPLYNSTLKHRPEVLRLSDWIRDRTQPGDFVLTDFPYMNVLADRPQPLGLANVSSNLTYTGYVDEARIRRSFEETPPSLILLQLRPHPWHLANVPGIQDVVVSWLSEYRFAGIKTPGDSVYLVFHRGPDELPGTQSDPERLRRILRPLFEKFEWGKLSDRLLPGSD